jgi:transcriptional regulator with XRE-family HTH domain
MAVRMKQSEGMEDKFINDNRLSIGDQVRRYREKRGYSQKELASLMNINRSTLSKIENGRFAVTVDYLAKLAVHLNFHFELTDNAIKKAR